MSNQGIEGMLRPAKPVAWWLALLVSLGALGFGIWCFIQQEVHGHIVTGLGNPGYGTATWGLYIAFTIYFVGVSFAGITVFALARLFRVQALRPATRAAEVLTIAVLMAGACLILADLGRPLDGLLKLPRFARPQSPFYGDFTLVMSGYLFSTLVFFFLASRKDARTMSQRGPRWLRWFYGLWATGYKGTSAEQRRHLRSSYWLSVSIVPLLVIAQSTLGFIFGIQGGRPGWYGALQAPGFVVLAGVSGIGMVILLLVMVRWMFGLSERIPARTIRWLGALMSVLALVYLYFTVVEQLTASFAAPAADRQVAAEVTGGVFAPAFWVTIACLGAAFAIPFVLYLSKRTSVAWIATAAALANVAAIFKRMLIVVPSQTHGAMIEMDQGTYWPNHIEIGLVLGLFGFVTALVLVFARVFPIVPSMSAPVAAPGYGADSRSWATARVSATAITILVAVTAIVFGLADSLRLFRDELDPLVPFSPVIFAAGVMLFFLSAVVYETFPMRKKKLPDETEDSAEE
jgi:molybdopterin-containing oxidoreductase family membrane subunit